jgi:hypothetical protein
MMESKQARYNKKKRKERAEEAKEKGLVLLTISTHVTPQLKQSITQQLNNRAEKERVR